MTQLSLFDAPEEPGLVPTDAAWQARLDRVDPRAYARTRNHLDGRVTGLSPWITHGLLGPPDVMAALAPRFDLGPEDKLVMELGWREYWQHVWRHAGEGIFADLRPAVWGGTYAAELPADLLEARTGVPAIDAAVRTLQATGTLHNHARMWLASYVTHLRKVHWTAGAAWMYGHLLDGDLASNALSWQWVAGTFSHKPYVFNAANVARYAPPTWHCPGTVIDRSYEALDAFAREARDVGPEPGVRSGTPPPALWGAPPPGACEALVDAGGGWWRPSDRAPGPLPSGPWRLVHPWTLRTGSPGERPCIGLLHLPFHARFPWSERRWRFVLSRMAALCEAIWVGDLADFPGGTGHRTIATLNPGYAAHLPRLATCAPVPRLTADPGWAQPSFTRFWATVREGLDLPGSRQP